MSLMPWTLGGNVDVLAPVWPLGRQIDNICWVIEKPREFQKIIYLCFIDYAKAFDCVDDHWKNHSLD